VATINPPPRRPPGHGSDGPAPTYAHAVEAFLIAHDRAGAWSAGTAVKYCQSLAILGTRLSDGPPAPWSRRWTPPRGRRTWRQRSLPPSRRWPRLPAPGTSPRCARHWGGAARGWLATDPPVGWARPKIARDHSRALARARYERTSPRTSGEQIAALWCLDVGLREKTLWRLLYETAARATEILTLDIADLDQAGKRARVISKGGDTDWVYY